MNKKLLVEHKKILSEGLQFHLIENIGIENNIYRPGSSKYFSLFREVRDLSELGLYDLNPAERYYINETSIGEWDFYNGDLVPLDYPILEGDESLKPSIPLEVLEETFTVWNIKRNQELERLNKGNRSEEVLRGLEICDRTLKYWNAVKNIIRNEQIIYKNC